MIRRDSTPSAFFASEYSAMASSAALSNWDI
jgi:hypothetical protein